MIVLLFSTYLMTTSSKFGVECVAETAGKENSTEVAAVHHSLCRLVLLSNFGTGLRLSPWFPQQGFNQLQLHNNGCNKGEQRRQKSGIISIYV